jgi:transposase-like protein
MTRPTTGVDLLNKYDGDPQAIERMKAILTTLSGQESVLAACARLGIHESLFRRFRDVCLQAGISALAPKKPGRKSLPVVEENDHIVSLEKEVKQLKLELMGARIREQLQVVGCSVPAKEVKKTKKKS